MLTNDDTIAAIATPAGAGGIGIVRVSGSQAPDILTKLFCRRQDSGPWHSHHLYLGRVVAPHSGALLDQALAVLMLAPNSYTREHVAELHCHGGPAVLAQVLAACLAAGARLAARGEFTLRAFLNGALSLDEAEAVADLVSAKTSAAARLAAQGLQGALSSRLEPLEQGLLTMLAELTVAVDFPDDADVPARAELLARIEALRARIEELLAGAEAGRIYREGFNVVLAGTSNVGKSSLLNRLLQAERAIVTASPGATRDIIEESLNLDGLPLLLRDTAGLRQAQTLDEAEELGMQRSLAALRTAQLILVVADAARGLDDTARDLLTQYAGVAPTTSERAAAEDAAAEDAVAEYDTAMGAIASGITMEDAVHNAPMFLVLNKCDLLTADELAALQESLRARFATPEIVTVSAKTGAGLEALKAKIKEKVLGAAAESGREPLLANIRHQQALQSAYASLDEARQTLADGLPPDMAMIDLENAYAALGEISGKTVSEEVLTKIFAEFCVGK